MKPEVGHWGFWTTPELMASLLWLGQAWCRLVTAAYNYFHVTNFFWMFGEGCYLHTAIVLTYSTDRLRKWMFVCIGWGKLGQPCPCLSSLRIWVKWVRRVGCAPFLAMRVSGVVMKHQSSTPMNPCSMVGPLAALGSSGDSRSLPQVCLSPSLWLGPLGSFTTTMKSKSLSEVRA